MALTQLSRDAGGAFILFYGIWTITSIVVSALYGRGWSPGQLLCDTRSIRHTDGRVIGAWRGMGRYLLFPYFFIIVATSLQVGMSHTASDVVSVRRTYEPIPRPA